MVVENIEGSVDIQTRGKGRFMTSPEDKINQQAFKWTAMEGIGVMARDRDRPDVIRDAMIDLKTVIDGCLAQAPSRDMFDTLARQCSIFLRKMALGDERNPPLLDAETCKAAGLVFHKLRAVRGERQIQVVVQNKIVSSKMRATLTDPETGELLGDMALQSDDPWEFRIDTEWPLPGIVDWVGLPTQETPWSISPKGLFDLRTGLDHDCSRWLGQQMVMFDNRAVALGNVIRAVVNAEGAHAPLVVPLMRPEDSGTRATPDTIKNPGAYILLCVVTCGITYAHVIAIESGLYLYLLLAQSGLVEPFKDADSVPEFLLTAPEAGSPPGQIPLRFEGSILLPSRIRPGGQEISHLIRAPVLR